MKRRLWMLFWLTCGARSLAELAQHHPIPFPGFSLPYWTAAIVAAGAFFFLGTEAT